jgi:hypothetical protein
MQWSLRCGQEYYDSNCSAWHVGSWKNVRQLASLLQCYLTSSLSLCLSCFLYASRVRCLALSLGSNHSPTKACLLSSLVYSSFRAVCTLDMDMELHDGEVILTSSTCYSKPLVLFVTHLSCKHWGYRPLVVPSEKGRRAECTGIQLPSGLILDGCGRTRFRL